MTTTSRPTDILILSEARTTHARRWAGALSRRGQTVAMLSLNRGEPIEGVQTLRFTIPPISLRHPHRWVARYRSAMKQVLATLRPRLVHMHFLGDWRLDRDLLGDTPLVISAWGTDVQPFTPEQPEVRLRKESLLRLANAVTATTPTLADLTAAYGSIRRDTIRVIPFGVDVERFEATPPPPSSAPPTVGFLKHLRPIYGPDVLIQAMRLVLHRMPEARLVMIGDGPMRPSLEAMAKQLNIAPSVKWLGAISHEQVPAALAEIDVLAMPSRQEAFGVAALEAQAAGRPVVASNLVGIRHAVVPDQTALLTPSDDPQALADALLRLLESPELRRAMGQAGREFVSRNFQWSTCVQQMMDLYATLQSHER